jgi:hypothetical protein
MHDCEDSAGIPLGRQRRDRLRLHDRSQQGQLTSTKDNGIRKPGNHSLASALLVNIGRRGRISNEKLEELLKSYSKNVIITAAIHPGDRGASFAKRASRYLARGQFLNWLARSH